MHPTVSKSALSVLLTVLLFAACLLPAFAAGDGRSVYEAWQIEPDSMRMTAHRGYSDIAPENTLPAFRLAGEYGFWGAECDTSPTADGVWIIMHDDTVDRMTDGEGKVKDLTFDEIRALTIDDGNNVESYPGTGVPTLEEYLDVCKEYGMHPVIEIKTCAAVEDMESLAALLSAREDKDTFVIITFGAAHAVRIKALLPQTPVYYLVGGDTREDFDAAIRLCTENGLDGIDVCWVWDETHVRSIAEAGLKTMAWTVDEPEIAARLYEWGVRDITTNRLTQRQDFTFGERVERKTRAIVETRLPFIRPVTWEGFSVALYLAATLCGACTVLLALAAALCAVIKKHPLTGALTFLFTLLAAVAGTYASRLFVLWDNLPLYGVIDAVFLLCVSGVLFTAACALNGFTLPKGKGLAGSLLLSLFAAAAPYEIALLAINTLRYHGTRPTYSVILAAFVPMALAAAAIIIVFAALKQKKTRNS